MPILRFENKHRRAIVIVHDLIVTLLACVVAGVLSESLRLELPSGTWAFLCAFFVAKASIGHFVFRYYQLYAALWRFASNRDFINIGRATTTLTVFSLLFWLIAMRIFPGMTVISVNYFFIFWFVQMIGLTAPRLLYRHFSDERELKRSQSRGDRLNALIVGGGQDADLAIRTLEIDAYQQYRPIGVLSQRVQDVGQRIRDVPVIGRIDALDQALAEAERRGTPAECLLIAISKPAERKAAAALIPQARAYHIPVRRLARSGQTVDPVDAATVAPLQLEDLLLRPPVPIPRTGIRDALAGRRICVTGAGGTIGRGLCQRAMAFGAEKLLMIDHSEAALHETLTSITTGTEHQGVEARICDIRHRDRLAAILNAFKPDVVFHAAALKHVPYLEADWIEGIATNVFGTVNAAELAYAAGAKLFVLISTDKAVEPVSILGASKRLAENVCQMMDRAHAAPQGVQREATPRFVSVRFGNVLGSSGSVVQLFTLQIQRGGPVTVTHPDVTRYFITLEEAVDLVYVAGVHAQGAHATGATSVYTLEMGQPVRILSLAHAMIQLSGLRPNEDIGLTFIGMRPGERLEEAIWSDAEPKVELDVKGMFGTRAVELRPDELASALDDLQRALDGQDRAAAEQVFARLYPSYRQRLAERDHARAATAKSTQSQHNDADPAEAAALEPKDRSVIGSAA